MGPQFHTHTHKKKTMSSSNDLKSIAQLEHPTSRQKNKFKKSIRKWVESQTSRVEAHDIEIEIGRYKEIKADLVSKGCSAWQIEQADFVISELEYAFISCMSDK